MACGHTDTITCDECRPWRGSYTRGLEPAFPMPSGPEPRVNSSTHYNEGMALRDYFAAHAMDEARCQAVLNHAMKSDDVTPKLIARLCYEIADAMLEAREMKSSKGQA